MTVSFWVDVSRHNGPINGARLAARGFDGVCARCVVGQAERDPLYLMAKEQAEDNGLGFGAYGVSWPANRDPRGDARAFLDKLIPSQRPAAPAFIVGDHELGLHTHPAGHHLLSGAQLVDYGIEYNLELAAQSDYDPLFYTAAWYWNSSKLKPFTDRGERAFKCFPAHYPYDPKQLPGLPPRYSKDELDPNEIGSVKPAIPAPWTTAELAAWQWTSKGRGAVDGYQTSVFMDRFALYLDLGGEPPPDEPEPPAPKVPVIVTVPSGIVAGELDVQIRQT